MASQYDISYFILRASAEREIAARTAEAYIAHIHLAFAEDYAARAAGSPPAYQVHRTAPYLR